MQDLILRTQSEVIALKQRAVKLARMWEERKHSTGSPRADRALVLMEVARDAALAAGVIQEIKMALDTKEFIDLLVKFRYVETVDDEGAARDFLSRQPKEKVEEGAARFFNVFKADLGRYGAIHLDRSGRPLLVEGPRLVEFVKWFVEQLLLEKEADESVRYFKGLEDGTIQPPVDKPRYDEGPAPAPSLIEVVKNVDISTGGLAVEGPELDTKGLVTGTYAGADSVLRGETALVRVGAKGVLAQFDNQDLEYAHGWHAFDLGEFELDANPEDEDKVNV